MPDNIEEIKSAIKDAKNKQAELVKSLAVAEQREEAAWNARDRAAHKEAVEAVDTARGAVARAENTLAKLNAGLADAANRTNRETLGDPYANMVAEATRMATNGDANGLRKLADGISAESAKASIAGVTSLTLSITRVDDDGTPLGTGATVSRTPRGPWYATAPKATRKSGGNGKGQKYTYNGMTAREFVESDIARPHIKGTVLESIRTGKTGVTAVALRVAAQAGVTPEPVN